MGATEAAYSVQCDAGSVTIRRRTNDVAEISRFRCGYGLSFRFVERSFVAGIFHQRDHKTSASVNQLDGSTADCSRGAGHDDPLTALQACSETASTGMSTISA